MASGGAHPSGDDAVYSGTKPVDPRHGFDPLPLADWMGRHVEGFRPPLAVEQFRGGQSNPTFRLSSPSGRYVLRRKPPGVLLPSAHAVDREYRVIGALQGSAVPVPRVHALCLDDAVIGTAFYIMDCVEGRVFWDPALPGLDPAGRAAVYDALNQVLASLHQVDYRALGLGDFGRPGNYFARQIDRWTRQYRASATEPIAAMERLIAWLPEHLPDDEETTLIHGDCRLDNMIFHPTEPRVLAVLDWELSTLGSPLGDLAYAMMGWRLRPETYRAGFAGRDLAALGVPAEAEFRDAYCRRTGRRGIANWEFYMAFNMFRLAAILQGIVARAAAGNAASDRALDSGTRARALAEAGWAQAERIA